MAEVQAVDTIRRDLQAIAQRHEATSGEPGALALLGIGLAGAAAARRRKA